MTLIRRKLSAVAITSLVAGTLMAAPARAQWEAHPEISLKEISVGNAGQIVGTNAKDEIWRYFGGKTWMRMPGAASKVSIASDGTLWVLNSGGNLYAWGTGDWVRKPGPANGGLPVSISVGNASSIWITTSNQASMYWNGSGWSGTNGALSNVASSASSTVLGVNKEGSVFRLQSDFGWTPWPLCTSPGPLNCIGSSSVGWGSGPMPAGKPARWAYLPVFARSASAQAWLLATDGSLFVANLASYPFSWQQVSGTFSAASAADNGYNIWFIDSGGKLYSGRPTEVPSLFDVLPKNANGFPQVRFFNAAANVYLASDATRDGGSETTTASAGPNTAYTLEPTFTDTTTFRLRNNASLACPYRHTAEATPIHHWGCWGDPAMEWGIIPLASGSVVLQSRVTRKCLTLSGGNVVEGECSGPAATFQMKSGE